ncbi:MAG: hypothetical protein IK090_07930, partial [Clostridia bacterium]|nr:hypothetical protein [Clostridia bacterium]
MKPLKTPFILLLALILLLAPVLSACSVVSVVESTTDYEDDDPDETTGKAASSATETTPSAPPATTEPPATTTEPEPEPIVRPPKKTVQPAATPYAPATASPYTSSEYTELLASIKTEIGATEVTLPSRAGVTYANPLPVPASLTRAANREELLAIANWHAFYREGSFAVTLDYPVSDSEAEVTFLARTSDLIPSLCSVLGTFSEGVLTVTLIYYPETYL